MKNYVVENEMENERGGENVPGRSEVQLKLAGVKKKVEKARSVKGDLGFLKLLESVEALVEICEYNDVRINLLRKG